MSGNIQPPPRLLLGASLLFWGAMNGNPLLGLATALLIESANWIRFRWDFRTSACAMAWKVCMVLILITGTLIWLDGDRYTAFPKLLTWLPLLLIPLQFVQSYGLRNWIPLNSFSFFTNLHRKRNLRLGLSPAIIRFNFGNVYFIVLIVAAGLGRYANGYSFFPCLVVLGGWLTFSRMKTRPLALVLILILTGVIGLGGQIGLSKLYTWVTDRAMEGGYPRTDPTINKTSIGSLGELKQSPEMLWRLKTKNGNRPPRLLRLATYNRYKGINWRNSFPDPIPQDEANFRGLTPVELADGGTQFLMREDMTPAEIGKSLPSFKLRGASSSEAPLPLPGNTSSLSEFELDGIEVNPVGTVRVFPKKSIIDGQVSWNDSAAPDSPPFPEEDLKIDEVEREGIEEVATSLGLSQLPNTAAKVARIRQFFDAEFIYTRYLTIGRAHASRRPTPIEVFLTTGKRGHCEYFATAATLLLRAADVPARYCVGYTVSERDLKRDEFVIRGIHGHAWSRYWDDANATWIDFDATPPGWLALETAGSSSDSRWLADTYQRLKEDFFLWRNRPANRIAATAVMWLIGLSVLAFVGRRLWKSRLVVASENTTYTREPVVRTPLHDLEKSARRLLGPRRPGMTYANWLAGLSRHGISPTLINEAISIHQQLRFDPEPAPSEHGPRLLSLSEKFRKAIKHTKMIHPHA